MMQKADLVLLVVIVIAIIVVLKVTSMWNKKFSKVEDRTTKDVFFGDGTIEELPQPHIVAEEKDDVPGNIFRAFNPSVTSVGEMMVFSYRVSNYVACPKGSGKATRSIFGVTDSKVKSFTMLSNEDGDVVYLDAPERAVGNCVSGFEDPRIIGSPSGDFLYVVCNSHSNEMCFTEMHLIKIPTRDLQRAFKTKTKPKTLAIKDEQIVRLREKSEDVPTRHQKNWMPFFSGDDLMFVYSVNPHVVLKCDQSTGLCTRVAETQNSFVNDALRGSSQARKYGDNFIAVAHWRTSSQSYLSQAYMFSSAPPFAITAISPTFVIEDQKEMALSTIQFVSGLEIVNEVAYIAYGQEDCDSKLFTVGMEALLGSMEDVTQGFYVDK
jgi:hypothetical protein